MTRPMTQEHLSEELLSRHFDGDLSAAEDDPVSAHLETCEQCSAQLVALERLSQLIKGAAVDSATAGAQHADFQSMFARIERATLTDVTDATDVTDVNGGGVPSMTATVSTATPSPGPARRRTPTPAPLKKLRRIGPVAPALGALAIAAAAMLMVFRADNVSQDVSSDDVQTDGVQFASSEIVDYDFGGNNGAVWDIAFADGSSVPVAWIDDDDDDADDEGQ